MTFSRSPTLAELLSTLRAGILRDLHVSCTARVLSYDSSKFEVDVQPIPADTFEDSSGTLQPLRLPVIVGVPFGGLEVGGFHVRVTPSVGDYVTVVFTDRSLDSFLASRAETAPASERRHSLTDAIAYPLFGASRPANLPACVSMGANTGSDDFVALASKVLSELNAIRNAFNTHVHPETGVNTSPPVTPMGAAGSVASASVNVRG